MKHQNEIHVPDIKHAGDVYYLSDLKQESPRKINLEGVKKTKNGQQF